MSLFDRMKEKLNEAGSAAQKLTRMGQLKLDLVNAESDLKARHRDLGIACAQRLIDREEDVLEKSESAIASLLDRVVHARNKVATLKAELDEV